MERAEVEASTGLEIQMFRQTQPYVRGVVPLLIYLRNGEKRNGEKLKGFTAAYRKADEFLGKLHDDIERVGERAEERADATG